MSSRLEPAALLVAPAVLVAARLAGIDALAVWCAFAVCVMLPGWGAMRLLRIERGLGLSGAAVVSTSLGLAIWIAPLAAAFAVHLPLTAPLVAVLIAGVVLCSVAVTRPLLFDRVSVWEAVAGALAAGLFAFIAWRISTGVISDALFHVGRMRKLEDIGSLSLTAISSYKDGAPHAGYAFPLLHAAFAGVADLAGVDVATAFIYLQPLCALLTMFGAFAVARSLTGWRTAGYLAAAVLAWDLVTLINGLIQQVNQPPVFTFFVLTPAAVLLFVGAMRGSRSAAWSAMAAVTVIALVHPTYAVPCLAIAAGIALGSWRAHLRMPPVALEALGASFLASAAVAAWIWWVAIRGGRTARDHHPLRRVPAPRHPRDPDVPVGARVRARLRAGGDPVPDPAGALPRPAAGGRRDARAADAAAAAGVEHRGACGHRDGPVPPLLAGAAVAAGRWPRARASPPACWECGAAWRWRWCWRWCWISCASRARSGACRPASSWWQRWLRWWWRCGCGRGGWSRAGRGGWPRCWSWR